MKLHLFLFLFATTLPVAFAQNFEFSVEGGLSHMRNNILGPDLYSPGAPATANVTLGNGFRLAFIAGFDMYTHLGIEFGYAYNRTTLTFQGGNPSEGMAVHQGFGDVLYYFTGEKSRIRPFAAGGIGFDNFVPPGSSAQYGQGENHFAVNYGLGIKARVTDHIQLRADFREYETGKPFGLGATGRLFEDTVSGGVGYVF